MKWNGKLKSTDQLQSSRTKCDSVCMEQWQLHEQEGKEVNEMMISWVTEGQTKLIWLLTQEKHNRITILDKTLTKMVSLTMFVYYCNRITLWNIISESILKEQN